MRKVFISSTSEDLEEYRKAARDAVIDAVCHPVMMEYWAAQGKRPPYPECMAKLDGCEKVVAIVAQRYGWVPDDQPDADAKSITRLECERAKEVIAFVRMGHGQRRRRNPTASPSEPFQVHTEVRGCQYRVWLRP